MAIATPKRWCIVFGGHDKPRLMVVACHDLSIYLSIYIYIYVHTRLVGFLIHSVSSVTDFWNMAGAGVILVLHRRFGRYSSLMIQVVLVPD